MSFIINIFKGILIGAGAILPGISSGVLCVVLGIYETLVSRVLHFFKDFKENFFFFLPLVIGGFISIIFISKALLYLLNSYMVPTSFCFIGLILGCIPSVFKQANSSSKRNNKFLKYLFLVFTFSFSIYLLALEKSSGNVPLTVNDISNFDLVKNGFLMSLGTVIPGISNTVILMILGGYNIYLEGLATFNLNILIPMGIGLVVGGFIFLRVIEFLFLHYKTYTYYAIIGFTLGSIFVLLPAFEFNFTFVLSIFLMIFCFFVSYKFSLLEKK